MSEDPWIHRSANMMCQTCMWYAIKHVDTQTTRGDCDAVVQPAQIGRCRRHAPTISGYPVVFPNDWCGDHKLDETK